jgi:RNA polymerase sigma-32 factor
MADLPAVKNSLESYLIEINRFPLLTPEEEFRLAVRYRKFNDITAAHRLITSHLRFVVKVAFEYRTYGVKLLDLIQEGNMALMTAVRKYDPDKGYRFISYAVWWIRAYIQNYIVKTWSLVRIGTTQAQKKLFYKIGKVRRTLESDQGEGEKYDLLAKELHVSKGEIVEMEQRMSSRDLSLDSTVDEGHELSPLVLLQDDRPNQEELFAQTEEERARKKKVLNALKRLNEKETHVIENRILADVPLSLQEIGNHLGLSRERVRQIESEALSKLKKQMKQDHPV